MTCTITLQPSGRIFSAESGETILEAALQQNVGLPYGCRNGACGACKAQVQTGEVDHGAAQAHALTDDEKSQGKTLLCCAKAKSDLVVACKEIGGGTDFPAKTFPSRVEEITRLAPDVIRLKLRLPSNERLQFHAGQYIDILLKDGQRRSFSMANAPHDDAFIELHIRHVPGGQFTEHVFTTLKARDILRLNGPHGSFYVREESSAPMILLAGGTGFAPIKAIVEHALHTGNERPIRLYWGARAAIDLYLPELGAQWAARHPNLRYVPVLSSPAADDVWTGRRGLVHEAVLAEHADLSGFQVYACGSSAMIEAAKSAFCAQRGLPDDAFFADAFTFAPPA